MLLLRTCGIQAQQPLKGQLPQDDGQFQQMRARLRRHGHIPKNVPGNVASALHGPQRQARPGAYMSSIDVQAYQATAQRTSDAGGAGAYFGQAQSGVQPGSFSGLIDPSATT